MVNCGFLGCPAVLDGNRSVIVLVWGCEGTRPLLYLHGTLQSADVDYPFPPLAAPSHVIASSTLQYEAPGNTSCGCATPQPPLKSLVRRHSRPIHLPISPIHSLQELNSKSVSRTQTQSSGTGYVLQLCSHMR